MDQLPPRWRPLLSKIAILMNAVPQVRWDRCVAGEHELRLYGWMDRPDDHADFVVLDVWPGGEGQPATQCAFLTSSPDPTLTEVIAKAIGIPTDDHSPCKRIEEVFGGMVTNAIELAPDCKCEDSIHRIYGDGWLFKGFHGHGDKINCPDCRKEWIHVCDEAEGCTWVPA